MTTEIKGPEHVDNLNSIAKLEAAGFVGSDASLAISLFEYDLVWRKLDNGSILFVYKIRDNLFDRCTLTPRDAEVEWDWIDWGSLLSFLDIASIQEFKDRPFEWQVYDVFTYYGYENTFGTSYWEGFEIEGDD